MRSLTRGGMLILLLSASLAWAGGGGTDTYSAPFAHTTDLVPMPRTIQSNGDSRLPSNSIIDMALMEPYLWVATGNGLARVTLTGPPDWPILNSSRANGFGNGGVSGLAVSVTSWGDTIVWAATAIDTTISGTDYAAGGGIGYSLDQGETWTWTPQPVDPADAPDIAPTTVSVQNVTYDIGIQGDRVWIASWAGGIRYFDMTPERLAAGGDSIQWVNRPPDDQPFDVLTNLNHRGFSIAVMDSLLWVGTAGGVNLSTDSGATWVNFKHSSTFDGSLTGNFVPSLGVQKTSTGQTILWAGTWVAEGSSQYYGISRTTDLGATWARVMGSTQEPVRTHNFGFADTAAFAASDDGLFKTVDGGQNWYLFPRINDIESLEVIYEPEVYSIVAAPGSSMQWELFVGGPGGLAYSGDNGAIWRILRSYPTPGQGGEPISYAYPNPFSPDRFEVVRVQYYLSRDARVTLEIYDFAMELLVRPVKEEWRPAGDRSEAWNGRGPGGGDIANGVYFYRLTLGDDEHWGKIMVLD